MKIGLGFHKYFDTLSKYELGDCFATFNRATGLEGHKIIKKSVGWGNPVALCEVTFFEGGLNEEQFKRRFHYEVVVNQHQVCIYIISSKGEILSTNQISEARHTRIFRDEYNRLNITIEGWVKTTSKGFFEIAERHLESGIPELGTWKSLPSKKVPGWLEAAVRFHSGQIDVPNKVVTIDSDGLDSELKFHCALGEAVNGPGGYFGRGLDGLSDCFCGGFGVVGKFTLNWLNHEVYKSRFPEYFTSIVEVFHSMNRTLNLC